MRKVSEKSKLLFYFMENNTIEDSRDDLPSIIEKRRNKYWAYTKE